MRRIFALVLAALLFGCAGVDRLPEVQPRRDSLTAVAQQFEQAAIAPAPVSEAITPTQPVNWGIFFEDAIRRDPRLPWENAQAPPAYQVSDSSANPPYISSQGSGCEPWNFWFNSGFYSRTLCGAMLGFSLDLKTTLVPEYSRGSSTPTFTRASVAEQIDFENKYNSLPSGAARMQGARVVQNLTPSNSENLNTGNWVGSSTTVTAASTPPVALPAGVTSASKLVLANDANETWRDTSAIVAGHIYAVSYYIVAASSGTWSAGKWDGSAETIIQLSVTTAWQRVGYTFTAAASSSVGQFVVEGRGTHGSLLTAWISGFQIEDVTGQTIAAPGNYVSVGVAASPIFNGLNVDGVKAFDTLNGNTVASNVVTEATGAPIITGASGVSTYAPVDAGGPFGYLAESAATQLVTPTADISDMTQATWVATTMTTAFTSVGPSGAANSATRLTATGAGATVLHLLVAAASSRTVSALACRVTGTGTVKLVQNTSKSADLASSISTCPAYRLVQLNANVDVTLLGYGIELGTSGDVVDVAMWQFEAGTAASSRILTGGATRVADVLSYALTGNIADAQGTVYAEVANSALNNTDQQEIVSTDNGNPLYLRSGTTLALFDGTAQRNLITFTPSLSVQKVASVWGNTTATGAIGGVIGTPQTFDGSLSVSVALGIGGNAGNQPFNGTIRQVKIWLSAVSNAQLTTQTAFLEAFMPYRVAWLEVKEAANDDEYLRRVNGR